VRARTREVDVRRPFQLQDEADAVVGAGRAALLQAKAQPSMEGQRTGVLRRRDRADAPPATLCDRGRETLVEQPRKSLAPEPRPDSHGVDVSLLVVGLGEKSDEERGQLAVVFDHEARLVKVLEEGARQEARHRSTPPVVDDRGDAPTIVRLEPAQREARRQDQPTADGLF
jgi:hypothetical protein